MDAINLRKLKRPQLIEIAEHFKIKKRHRLRKRDLIKALEKRLAEIPEKFSAAFQKPKHVETSTRFAPSAPAPQPPFVDRGAPLPLQYGQDHATLLVRDPNSLYVFWELEGGKRDEVARRFGSDVFHRGSWVLRLHNDAGQPSQDMPVVYDGRNWYLSVADDCGYVVELGLRVNGGFVGVIRSNHVRTPRAGVSSDMTAEWMLVEDDFRRVAKLAPGKGPKVGGRFAEALAERFRVPGMGSRFLGASERVAGSGHMRRESKK